MAIGSFKISFRLDFLNSSGLDPVILKQEEKYKNCKEHFCRVKTIDI